MFKTLSLFIFSHFSSKLLPLYMILGGLCQHKFISEEYLCCLGFFQWLYIFEWYTFWNAKDNVFLLFRQRYFPKEELSPVLLNWGDQGANKIGIYSPRSTSLERLVVHLVNVFFVDSVLFHLADITFKWSYACLER